MYQALYRKYRPRCFNDVAGQEHITETLRRQVSQDRLSHAYLFVGTRGTGKTTCAKILARVVNCENPDGGEPCNKCANCIGIDNGSILDVLELDAASNNGVDNVRALREEAVYSPASVRKRVYIIDEVHMLSNAAFNALLKILEEPPEHLLFILATTELHKVPATILSRCQRFSFKRLSPAVISARLRTVAEDEGLVLAADAADKLAALADGSMRDALSLLDQCASDTSIDLQHVLDTIGLAGQREIAGLAAAAAGRDAVAALSLVGSLYDGGKDMAALLSETAMLFRDVLVFKLSKDSPLLSGSYGAAELSGLSEILAPERLFFFLDVIRETVFALARGGGVKLPTEMCFIRMCDERLDDGPSAILSRISRLEESAGGRVEPSGSLNAIASLATDKSPVPTGPCPVETPSLLKRAGDGDQKPDVTGVAGDGDRKTDVAGAAGDGDRKTDVAGVAGDGDSGGSNIDMISGGAQPDTGSVFWERVLDLLRGDAPVYAVLSNSARVRAELRDNTLLIRAADELVSDQIVSKMFSVPLLDAARKVAGREVLLRVELGGGVSDDVKPDKLDSLSAFGIIKFE